MKRLFLICILFLPFIYGCASTKTNTVTVVRNVFVQVPSELTQPCSATAPISETEYENLSPYDKEYWLSNYSLSLLKDLAVCSDKVIKIDKWSKQQELIFSNKLKDDKDDKSGRPK
jgi:hypothetical protein